jgi:hypothetical protein
MNQFAAHLDDTHVEMPLPNQIFDGEGGFVSGDCTE